MAILEYTNVPEDSIKIISNGCGSRYFILDVPEFVFHDSCDKHDFHYWRGGTEADRKKADKEFYSDMKIDAQFQPWWKRLFLKGMAWLYYLSVRLGGKTRFSYGDMKTEEDLPV